MEIITVTVVLIASVILLVSGKLPVDLTALGIMVALMVTGILEPAEALAGFANPAPITVGALLVLSRGLIRTGALDYVSNRIMRITRGRPGPLLLLSLFIAGTFSAFINNTPVVVLFISIVMAVCARHALAPSKFLLPISFISILAGSTTLIGTSTNIIVSDLSSQMGSGPISMFELTRLGLPLSILGAAFLYFFSFRLLPAHKEPTFEQDDGKDHHYLSELLVPPESPLLGRDPRQALAESYPDIEVFELIRDTLVFDVQTERSSVQPRDILLVKASASDLAQILSEKSVVLPKPEQEMPASPYDTRSLIVELIVPPNSNLLGQRLMRTPLGLDADILLMGVKRRHAHFARPKLSKLQLMLGDILLVQCPLQRLELLRADSNLIVVEEVVKTLINRRKAPLASLVFLTMVAAAALGVANILVCALTATFVLILSGALSLREAYGAVDVKVLLLIIGTLALGSALQKTGAADLYADRFLSLFQGSSPEVVLGAFVILTSLLSHFLSNNSTAVLLVPVALSTAASLGVDARPFIIGICFGASACYASPIGYQTNMLVYGPGGYHIRDFIKLGIPLNLLVWAGSALLIPVLWPF